ncbi:chromatin complexes subunit BAP18-like isoform X2 [Helicoverpa zea]|uniref:chromatin complexes subunit BAP18-like isoform X2 n=1 Tax=Helicoverpa zea TaxID=7113 RepID=UPI001F57C7F6|nr:chromatin complexes subunit BAP18-like isoform X2 [Helicoverpa zea]
MDGTTAKVSEIFREVGTAFSTLSEITISLQHTEECPPGGKWTEEEVEMLRGCIKRFAEELNKITHHIKTRTINRLRTNLKEKAFKHAGIPVRKVTLNMLNASEAEEADGLSREIKLEFDSAYDEAAI